MEAINLLDMAQMYGGIGEGCSFAQSRSFTGQHLHVGKTMTGSTIEALWGRPMNDRVSVRI